MKSSPPIEWRSAIYVGPVLTSPSRSLDYGRTGRLSPPFTPLRFFPDGQAFPIKVSKADIYIQSQDRTRYCPKPTP